MNEETLQALTQLLALVTLQDGVITETERNYVINLYRQDLDPATLSSYLESFDRLSGYDRQKKKTDTPRKQGPISLNDTVKTLAICNKLNKILEIRQKVFLLLKVLQLIAVDGRFSIHRKRIIETISAVFNIREKELGTIGEFVFYRPGKKITDKEILIVNDQEPTGTLYQHINAELSGELIFLKLSSIDMYFVKYYGEEEIILNGFMMNPGMVYMFTNGSAIKTQQGPAIYFSDLIRKYLRGFNPTKISLNAENVTFKFSQHEVGLHNFSVSEEEGNLIGILGASGSGKTTLLNVLAGIYKPTEGEIRINGIDIHTNVYKQKLKGMVGYISQDDMLIEELTLYQNLYYNAKLCFADLPDREIRIKVKDILKNLGLWERKDMPVGNVLNKKISGGQRKRLNIALELIREPSILFIDEPTSGLSSRDSENVMDLLKELTYRGKLIFVVIHQPSSDIFKLFDQVIILDEGGHTIYYGNPIEAVTYFKGNTRQLDKERGICPTCGNVNPEQIFNIVEEKKVDEFGIFTNIRKVKPVQWAELYLKNLPIKRIKDKVFIPEQKLHIPSRLNQISIFIRRDILSKLSDRQYLVINLLEAPVLAFVLAGIVRYQNAQNGMDYIFRLNENIPVFFIMSIIVVLFLGLMVSAEEIIHDRKILKREGFLNLSRNSYLLSKITVLFFISAIQTFSFTVIGNLILEIKGMILPFWLILFSVSCFGNMLGLNISDTFRSTVTVYILIPLLIIPQMILSGLFVSYDKIHESIGNKARVPIIADLMTSRWAYEAMAVYQFIHNDYESRFYPIDQTIAEADYKSTYYAKKLEDLIGETLDLAHSRDRSIGNMAGRDEKLENRKIRSNLQILYSEFRNEPQMSGLPGDEIISFSSEIFDQAETEKIYREITGMKNYYRRQANEALVMKDNMIRLLEAPPYHENLDRLKNDYYNERLADLVRNIGTKERVVEYRSGLEQLIDPVFQLDLKPRSVFDYRTHLFLPRKQLLGVEMSTNVFNLMIIWLFSFILYITLFFQAFKKALYFRKYKRPEY